MDDEALRPAEPSDPGKHAPPPPPSPDGPTPDPLASQADELRRLVDAGASSPEELRALAERIREHKALEESRWRSEVRPDLMKSKKGGFHLRNLATEREDSNIWLGMGLFLAVVVILLVAILSSPLLLVVPVVGVLIYAYRLGTDTRPGTDREETPPS